MLPHITDWRVDKSTVAAAFFFLLAVISCVIFPFFYKLLIYVSFSCGIFPFFYKLLISVSSFVQYFPFIYAPLFSYFIFIFGTVNFITAHQLSHTDEAVEVLRKEHSEPQYHTTFVSLFLYFHLSYCKHSVNFLS